jgi:hypothetical protein
MLEKGWIEESLFKRIRQSLPIAAIDILAVNEGRLLLMLRNLNPRRTRGLRLVGESGMERLWNRRYFANFTMKLV